MVQPFFILVFFNTHSNSTSWCDGAKIKQLKVSLFGNWNVCCRYLGASSGNIEFMIWDCHSFGIWHTRTKLFGPFYNKNAKTTWAIWYFIESKLIKHGGPISPSSNNCDVEYSPSAIHLNVALIQKRTIVI